MKKPTCKQCGYLTWCGCSTATYSVLIADRRLMRVQKKQKYELHKILFQLMQDLSNNLHR